MTRITLLWTVCAALPAVDFNREIRPILSDRCYQCHGPDSVNRKANLRLDQEASAKAKISEVLERIGTANKGRQMPPVYSGKTLSDAEKALLRKWHWSFLPPTRDRAETIDTLVRKRLKQEGLEMSRRAERATLLRRVALDLTGLPPAPEEQQAFLGDAAPNAFEKAVDRLLASPRYAERMTARWLDAARYADTNGYQTDAERFMWRWRDWVLDAYNKNMPFDQFTIEQLAGDLLPNARRVNIIATGFNRNHRSNGEGGSIDAEFLAEYAIDRAETTATVWLGLTAGCARCHDHKYDPISQKEFYSLYAFFNNLPEKGKTFKYGNSPPTMIAPTPEQERAYADWERKVTAARDHHDSLFGVRGKAMHEWQIPAGLRWMPSDHLVAQFANRAEKPKEQVAEFGFYDKFTLSAWIQPTQATGAILTKAVDKEEQPGYGLYLKDGKVQVNLVQRWLDDCLRVETEAAVPLHQWTHVAMSYDGSLVADGVRIYLNGEPAKLKYVVDDLNQTFAVKEPLRVGAGNGMPFHGEIEDARAYAAVLPPGEVAMLADRGPLAEASEEKRREAFLWEFGPAAVRDAYRNLKRALEGRKQYLDSIPTVMVMKEMTPRREARVLRRGQYDQPGDVAPRAIPAALGRLADADPNRLTLARWLVSRENPLTARVTVNRFWQMLFGAGLVKTAEDFGAQGEMPVHSELLDWLAVEFMENGWDVKKLLKTIVLSETYQQDSRIMHDKDPDNRLLSRGPRLRLAPEMVRDQALAASGLLVEKLGGKSVKPYQPAGLWKELSGGEDYARDQGENLYRRSLYTFWKRAAPPPGMMTFDSAGREACTVRENRTNTPLQALTLMNDETYLEAARKLAERMIREGGASERGRIARGYALLLAREAKPAELDLLTASLHRHQDRFKTNAGEAAKLLHHGDSPRDASIAAGELAAYTLIASALLNLDEAVTKE